MKTKYKYIYFTEDALIKKRPQWNIYNNRSNSSLGHLEYYPAWRQYVLVSDYSVIWNKDCLLDVIDFIKQL